MTSEICGQGLPERFRIFLPMSFTILFMKTCYRSDEEKKVVGGKYNLSNLEFYESIGVFGDITNYLCIDKNKDKERQNVFKNLCTDIQNIIK